MEVYASDINFGVLTFPLLAFALSLPYAIYQYRVRGGISWWKTLVVFSFIFYLLVMYYLCILPLPESGSFDIQYAKKPQLVPFEGWKKILEETNFSLSDRSTWLSTLASHATYSKLFNILMTAPLGMYLGYFFHRKWWQCILIGFCVSLFIELTQLSGLYGIYEYPYREFDVDDLIDNTFGTLLGFWIMLPIRHTLPDIDAIDRRLGSRERTRATAMRRLAAFTCDFALYLAVLAAFLWAFEINTEDSRNIIIAEHLCITLVFLVPILILRNQTLGHALLRLEVVRPNGTPARRLRSCMRYLVLYWGLVLMPQYAIVAAFENIPALNASLSSTEVFSLVVCVYLFWAITLIFRAVLSALGHPLVMLNGIVTSTRIWTCAQVEARKSAAGFR